MSLPVYMDIIREYYYSCHHTCVGSLDIKDRLWSDGLIPDRDKYQSNASARVTER